MINMGNFIIQGLFTCFYVFQIDGHVIVTIWPLMFVIESQRVHQLVNDKSWYCFQDASVVQTNSLFLSNLAHVTPATFLNQGQYHLQIYQLDARLSIFASATKFNVK